MDADYLLNARILGRAAVTGVERYAAEVARRLDGRVRWVRPARPLRGLVGHRWEQAVLPSRVRGNILWSPANTGPLAVANQVVTIHDMSALDHPEWFAPAFAAWYRWLLPRLARRVQQVITDSEFSKARIVARLGVAADRVVVVPPGVDTARFHPASDAEVLRVRRRYQLPPVYALCVGSLEPRKNLRRLFQSWEIARPPAALALVGETSGAFRASGFEQVPPGVRLLGRVGDDDLAGLYSGAAVFVMPSLYEGFGLPVLEAMACGAPVIAADAGGLPEAVGDAGLLVSPTEAAAMAEAVGRVLADDELRQSWREKGFERAGRFSWERTAEGVWDVLHE